MAAIIANYLQMQIVGRKHIDATWEDNCYVSIQAYPAIVDV